MRLLRKQVTGNQVVVHKSSFFLILMLLPSNWFFPPLLQSHFCNLWSPIFFLSIQKGRGKDSSFPFCQQHSHLKLDESVQLFIHCLVDSTANEQLGPKHCSWARVKNNQKTHLVPTLRLLRVFAGTQMSKGPITIQIEVYLELWENTT